MEKIKVLYKDRIDKYISNNNDISRNDVNTLIENKQIFVNDIEVRKNKFVVNENDVIEIKNKVNKEINIEAQKMELNIIFENKDYIVINKSSGMVVHPAPGNFSNTLVNGLLYYFKNGLSDLNGELRPGIVHRIDKDTSGLLLVAKNNKTHQYFANLLKEHKIARRYLAIVESKFEHNEIEINLPIGRDINNRQKMKITNVNAKEAITNIKVLKQNENFSLIECSLKTGRTHQIRVHLSHINKAVYGDSVYGKKIDDFNQRLHAYNLSFVDQEGKLQNFYAPLPKQFEEELRKNNLLIDFEELKK